MKKLTVNCIVANRIRVRHMLLLKLVESIVRRLTFHALGPKENDVRADMIYVGTTLTDIEVGKRLQLVLAKPLEVGRERYRVGVVGSWWISLLGELLMLRPPQESPRLYCGVSSWKCTILNGRRPLRVLRSLIQALASAMCVVSLHGLRWEFRNFGGLERQRG